MVGLIRIVKLGRVVQLKVNGVLNRAMDSGQLYYAGDDADCN